MRRFPALVSISALAALVCATAVVLVLFSRELERARNDSAGRMHFAAEHTLFLYEQGRSGALDSLAIPQHLARLALVSGIERIVVTDTLGLIRWSSNPVLGPGEDISPFLIDSAGWRETARDGKSVFSAPKHIGGERFRSLYSPLRTDDGPLVVVVDVDQGYFAAGRSFRNNVLLLVLSFTIIATTLSIVLIRLADRVETERRNAARNERLAFLGQVAAQLAHELKNPLAIMKASADVLRKRLADNTLEKPVAFIAAETMRLTRLINEILCFSRERPFEPELVNLAQAWNSAVGLQPAVENASPSLIIEIDKSISVYAAPESAVQIAANLLSNALRAAGSSGSVRVWSHSQGVEAHVLIEDSGPGVDAKLGESVFEPFVSGSSSGTGLGLAIVRQLCERNGWRIRLNSAVPAIFDITFPEGTWRAC